MQFALTFNVTSFYPSNGPIVPGLGPAMNLGYAYVRMVFVGNQNTRSMAKSFLPDDSSSCIAVQLRTLLFFHFCYFPLKRLFKGILHPSDKSISVPDTVFTVAVDGYLCNT